MLFLRSISLSYCVMVIYAFFSARFVEWASNLFSVYLHCSADEWFYVVWLLILQSIHSVTDIAPNTLKPNTVCELIELWKCSPFIEYFRR